MSATPSNCRAAGRTTQASRSPDGWGNLVGPLPQLTDFAWVIIRRNILVDRCMLSVMVPGLAGVIVTARWCEKSFVVSQTRHNSQSSQTHQRQSTVLTGRLGEGIIDSCKA